jgi:hypothetical protein
LACVGPRQTLLASGLPHTRRGLRPQAPQDFAALAAAGGLRSFLAVPIGVPGRVLGALTLASAAAPGPLLWGREGCGQALVLASNALLPQLLGPKVHGGGAGCSRWVDGDRCGTVQGKRVCSRGPAGVFDGPRPHLPLRHPSLTTHNPLATLPLCSCAASARQFSSGGGGRRGDRARRRGRPHRREPPSAPAHVARGRVSARCVRRRMPPTVSPAPIAPGMGGRRTPHPVVQGLSAAMRGASGARVSVRLGLVAGEDEVLVLERDQRHARGAWARRTAPSGAGAPRRASRRQRAAGQGLGTVCSGVPDVRTSPRYR